MGFRKIERGQVGFLKGEISDRILHFPWNMPLDSVKEVWGAWQGSDTA